MGAVGTTGMSTAWLPPLISFNDYGDWDVYVEVIYGHFRTDFVHSRPSFAGKPCWITSGPLSAGKEPTFWHITSTGKVEDERTPDLRRCERIRWPRPLIEAHPTNAMCSWRVKRDKKWRLNLAPLDFSYLVVLADLKKSVLLITTYWVAQEHHRQKLKKEWEQGKV
jgi:hypothetical protein